LSTLFRQNPLKCLMIICIHLVVPSLSLPFSCFTTNCRHAAYSHDLLDGKMIWYWFFILLSAASQYIQKGLRIDPCTPAGYSYSMDSWKSSPSSHSEKNQYQPTVRTRGNFSECRSAALMLLQKGKGCVLILVCIVRSPLNWYFPHCCLS